MRRNPNRRPLVSASVAQLSVHGDGHPDVGQKREAGVLTIAERMVTGRNHAYLHRDLSHTAQIKE